MTRTQNVDENSKTLGGKKREYAVWKSDISSRA